MSEKDLRKIEIKDFFINNIEIINVSNYLDIANSFFGKDYLDNFTIKTIYNNLD